VGGSGVEPLFELNYTGVPVQVSDVSDPTGRLTSVVGLASGTGPFDLAVKRDGTVRGWGDCRSNQFGNACNYVLLGYTFSYTLKLSIFLDARSPAHWL
jgi:hypothetical protein